MQVMSRMDLARVLRFSPVVEDETWDVRAISVGRWMAILGLTRLAVVAAGWLMGVAGAASDPEPPAVLSTLGRALAEQTPLAVLALGWPVLIGILVSRTRWPELVRAASVTFLLLGVAGVLKAAFEWGIGDGALVDIGPVSLSRSDLASATPRGLMLVLLGMAQILAELLVARRGFRALAGPRPPAGSGSGDRPSMFDDVDPRARSVVTTGAWIFSAGFLLMAVRLPTPPKLTDVIGRSPWLRDLLLMNDHASGPRRPRPFPADAEATAAERDAQQLVMDAIRFWEAKRFDDASLAYQKAIAIYRNSGAFQDGQGRGTLAMLDNNLAWLLVTRPDPKPGDPEMAVEHAQRAVGANPSDGNYYWNTLAASHYRAKNWQSAKEALLRSMELRGDGDGYDWILFSLIHAQTGRKDRAREWYEKASRWRRDFRPWDRDFYQFEVEAAALLGLPEPPVPPRPRPFRYYEDHDPMTNRGRGLPATPYLGESKKYRRGERRPPQ